MSSSSRLVRLYPASWRERYADEFEAILEERPLGPFDVADIILGALDAQLRLRGVGADARQGRGFPMSLRIGGMAAILGGALWAAGMVAAFGLVGIKVDPIVASLVLIAGSLALLVALAGLSAFQARTQPRLVWAAFAVPAIGTVLSIVGVVGMGVNGDRPMLGDLSAWYVWVFGSLTAFAGSGLFAIATYRTAVLSRRAAALLGVGSILPIAVVLIQATAFAPGFEAVALLVSFACYTVGWMALGIEAIRLDRPSTEPRPA